MTNTQITLRYDKCEFCGGLVYIDMNMKDPSVEVHMCKDCSWTTIVDLPEKKTSNYVTTEFNEMVWDATKNTILNNKIIDEVDAQIEAEHEALCSNCNLHRMYRQ